MRCQVFIFRVHWYKIFIRISQVNKVIEFPCMFIKDKIIAIYLWLPIKLDINPVRSFRISFLRPAIGCIKFLWSHNVLELGKTNATESLNFSYAELDFDHNDKKNLISIEWNLTPLFEHLKSFFCCCRKRFINGVSLFEFSETILVKSLSSMWSICMLDFSSSLFIYSILF